MTVWQVLREYGEEGVTCEGQCDGLYGRMPNNVLLAKGSVMLHSYCVTLFGASEHQRNVQNSFLPSMISLFIKLTVFSYLTSCHKKTFFNLWTVWDQVVEQAIWNFLYVYLRITSFRSYDLFGPKKVDFDLKSQKILAPQVVSALDFRRFGPELI